MELFEAAKKGDISSLEALVSGGNDVNTKKVSFKFILSYFNE